MSGSKKERKSPEQSPMQKHHCHEQQFHARCFGQQKHPMHGKKVKSNLPVMANIFIAIEENTLHQIQKDSQETDTGK